jgi:hypothetical protein
MTIDTRRASAYPPIHRGDGWHTHPSATAAAFGCEVCDEEDRLELEQGQPVPEWARDGRGVLVRIHATRPTTTVRVDGPQLRFADRRKPDHELEPIACERTRASHVHYATEIAWPAGYWPDAPSDEQRA